MKRIPIPLPRQAASWALAAILGFLSSLPAAAQVPMAQTVPMQSPVRLACGPKGLLVVTDYNARAVFTVNHADLKTVDAFAVPGRPTGIAWASGKIFVGNETTGTVEVYNPSGQWLYDLGGAKGLVRQPNDIAVDKKSRRVFVVDGRDKVVKVFDMSGPFLFAIGAGHLANPTGIVLDEGREQVLVSDYGDPAATFSARVRIFDYAGNPVFSFGGRAGGFSRPQGMAVDGEGHLFLADGLLGQILVFDQATGAGLKTLGEFGLGPGQLQLPLDVVLDPESKDLFVTNNRAARIEVFKAGGSIP